MDSHTVRKVGLSVDLETYCRLINAIISFAHIYKKKKLRPPELLKTCPQSGAEPTLVGSNLKSTPTRHTIFWHPGTLLTV